MKKPDLVKVCGIVNSLVKDAEKYRGDRAAEREKAMIFFDGEAKDLQKYIPTEEGRSTVVSRDVRSAVKKVLPSLYRTILGNDQLVEYQPLGEGDEDMADQATDYMNYVVLPECDGRQAIEDSINDAVRLRNGVLKWWHEEKIEVKSSLHSGLDEMSFVQLVAADDIKVTEHSQREEEGQPVHDVRIRRKITKRSIQLCAIPPENFLIHPDATCIDDSVIIGENTLLRRSDLLQMGYKKADIWDIPSANASPAEQDSERNTRRRDIDVKNDAPERALDEIDYYDLLVRVDYDGDGIAEFRRMVFAGGIKEEYLLENVEADEVNYADIVSERRPHQWEGNSVPDDVMEIQTIKTALLRQTMDNLYWQNMPQRNVVEGSVVNPEALTNPQYGGVVRYMQGTDLRASTSFDIVPFVADKSFAMLEYLDNEIQERTGISDASSGMAPDALQNMTAKASAMVEQAGIGQTEMMVRCVSQCLKPVFRGLLKLVIQHQDKPRTVRLRDKWVQFDPRTWNSDMDVTVNVGLGAGTRERDMMAMQQVITLQERILASMGPAIGMQYVTPDNLYNSVSKMTEAAGLRSVNLYFTKPEPEAIQQALQAQSQQPSPEEIQAKAALELEQVRTQGQMQVEGVKAQTKQQEFAAKIQAEASKEHEQRDADLATNMAQMDRQSAIDIQQAQAEAVNAEQDRQLKRDELALNYQMHQEDLQSREVVASENRQANVEKAQATSIGKALEKNETGEE